MEDTNSCPAFIEREASDDFTFTAAESPTISRLTSRFENSILNSPTVGLSYDTPATPPHFAMSTPKKTPVSPSILPTTPAAVTPYNCFLKRRCLYSPRRSSSVSSMPIKWDDEQSTRVNLAQLSASDDTFLTSPAINRKRGLLAQSTMDFSTLMVEETKARLLDTSPYKEAEPIPCILPTIPNSTADFNRIDGNTLVDLINGKYEDSVEDYVIMDCRYNYEYEGGHIKGAINMAPHNLFEYFANIPEPVTSTVPKRKLVIIMHCEFSSVRAPKCIEILRSLDRTENFQRGYRWPLVSYPDVYLLQGGYKKFYETQLHSCVPEAYVPEKSKEHKVKRQESKRARKQQLKKSSSGLSVSKKLVYFNCEDDVQPPSKARRCNSYPA